MVQFVDVKNVSRWISTTGLDNIFDGLVSYVESDFKRWENFEKRPRVASHSHYGVIELMPTSDGSNYSFKYVNGHPINTKKGLQTVTAFGVIADVESGYPTFISEMTLLTALRTAATSVVAASPLLNPGVESMSMIGTGSQSEFQAIAFRSKFGIQNLKVWDTDPEAMEKFVLNLEPLGFDITVAKNANEAVAGAQLITTCTADKTNATILTEDMVAVGAHINALGGDCPGKTELDADLLRKSKIFVELTEQTRIEGEIQQLEADSEVTELWTVLRGSAEGRSSHDMITIFDSVGFAIEDFSVLRYLQNSVQGTDYFEELDLIAEPSDPKNLFSLISENAVW